MLPFLFFWFRAFIWNFYFSFIKFTLGAFYEYIIYSFDCFIILFLNNIKNTLIYTFVSSFFVLLFEILIFQRTVYNEIDFLASNSHVLNTIYRFAKTWSFSDTWVTHVVLVLLKTCISIGKRCISKAFLCFLICFTVFA